MATQYTKLEAATINNLLALGRYTSMLGCSSTQIYDLEVREKAQVSHETAIKPHES